MEAIPIAVALQSGEMASGIIGLIEEHPLLELCGVARSIPDLLRLLPRFNPPVLLVSPSLLEDLEPDGIGPQDSLLLSRPLSFLLRGSEASWGEDELARVLHQPLRYAGMIGHDVQDENELYRLIAYKVELYADGKPAPGERYHGPARASRGRGGVNLITVTGAKGGVGTTLICCGLAALIASDSRRVLLLDMDRELSQTLHIKPRGEGKTFLDLLPLAEELSWDLVRVSVHLHAAGFHVLPYGHLPDERKGGEGGMPEHFLRNLLFLFDTVILDIPRPAGQDILRLLHHSPLVLLVSPPDALSANCARSAAARLRQSGLDRRRMRLVVNRCGPRHVLGPEELAGAVGLELCAALPEDGRAGMDFAELGEIPPGDSHLGRALAQMASALGLEVDAACGAPTLSRLRRGRRRPHGEAEQGGGR